MSFGVRMIAGRFDLSQPAMRLRWALIFFLTMFAYMMVKANWISDPDTYWHIVVGQDIWTTQSFPTVDQYSHTVLGEPWIAKEWLAQLIFFAAYETGGWSGVILLSCTLCALSLTLLFWRFLSIVRWTVAVGLVWIAMPFLSLTLLARPQAFSFLFFAIAILEIELAVHERRRPRILMLPLAILWANLHASFPILLVLLAFGAADVVFRAEGAHRIRLMWQWALIGLGVILCFGVTPYGYGSLLVSTQIVGSDLSKYILEWRPIDLSFQEADRTASLILAGWLLFLMLGALVLVYRYPKWPLRLAPMMFFAVMTVRHIRFCSMFTIVSAVTVARPIAERFQRFSNQSLPVSRGILGTWRLLVVASTLIAVGAFYAADRTPDKSITPSAALTYARAMGLSGKIYNSYVFGGYLIANNVPTLIDGRAELFLGRNFKTIVDPVMTKNKDLFQKSIQDYGVDWALVRTESNEAAMLDTIAGWSKIYSDNVATIFLRDAPGR